MRASDTYHEATRTTSGDTFTTSLPSVKGDGTAIGECHKASL